MKSIQQFDVDFLSYVTMALIACSVLIGFHPVIVAPAMLSIVLLQFIIKRHNWARRVFIILGIVVLPFQFAISDSASQTWVIVSIMRGISAFMLLLRLVAPSVRQEFTQQPSILGRQTLVYVFTGISLVMAIVIGTSNFESSPIRKWVEKASLAEDETFRNELYQKVGMNIPAISQFYFRQPVIKPTAIAAPVVSFKQSTAALLFFNEGAPILNPAKISDYLGDGWAMTETESREIVLPINTRETKVKEMDFTIEGIFGESPKQRGYLVRLQGKTHGLLMLIYGSIENAEGVKNSFIDFLSTFIAANSNLVYLETTPNDPTPSEDSPPKSRN